MISLSIRESTEENLKKQLWISSFFGDTEIQRIVKKILILFLDSSFWIWSSISAVFTLKNICEAVTNID